MNIQRFYTDILGANLRNSRWSWGAIDPITNRIFLRVWDDEIERVNGRERVLVSWVQPHHSLGFPERKAHIAQFAAGAEAFGVICTAVDANTTGARSIGAFDAATLLRLGRLTHENGGTYAHIDGRVRVVDVMRQRTAQSTLAQDLKSLTKQDIDATTKDVLINARVGQGIFRTQVLRLWESRCSVSGSTTLDAIRASHIKPWRSSSNEERLDPANGLPLIASLDSLFDAGLITFASSGSLVISSAVDATEQEIFSVANRSLRRPPAAATELYLAYHRAHVFRQ